LAEFFAPLELTALPLLKLAGSAGYGPGFPIKLWGRRPEAISKSIPRLFKLHKLIPGQKKSLPPDYDN
jgi:hypothetical protein